MGLKNSISSRLNLQKKERGILPPFRMTSMIDVIFLLLIFFLLTANFRPLEDYLLIQTPKASKQSGFAKVEPLMICVNQVADNVIITIDGKSLEIQQGGQMQGFLQMIKDILDKQGRKVTDPIEFVCQAELNWQNIVDIYNCLFAMGINDISFQTTNE